MPTFRITIPCPGCCAVFCRDLWGDTIYADIAGILACAGSTIVSGINVNDVALTFGAVLPNVWSATIGVIDPNGSGNENYELRVACSGENELIAYIGLEGGVPGLSAFSNFDPGWHMLDAITNNNLLADCTPFGPTVAYDGTVTVRPTL